MKQNVVQVDAFTDRAFGGNPAAVCIMREAAPDDWMRNVAREMNLSETAFLSPENGGYRLRWFTPSVEVALCGHATLASAHVLWQDGTAPRGSQLRFHTQSGLLTADEEDGWIKLDFPAKLAEEVPAPAHLLESLNIKRPKFVGRNIFDYIVEVETEDEVRALQPDHNALRKVGARGVMVTAVSKNPEFDFVSRFFAPGSGIDEDPATGSAHTCLAPYWAERLGKTEMMAYQASERGGILKLALRGDRVWIYGQAVTVMKGELYSE